MGSTFSPQMAQRMPQPINTGTQLGGGQAMGMGRMPGMGQPPSLGGGGVASYGGGGGMTTPGGMGGMGATQPYATQQQQAATQPMPMGGGMGQPMEMGALMPGGGAGAGGVASPAGGGSVMGGSTGAGGVASPGGGALMQPQQPGQPMDMGRMALFNSLMRG